MTTKQQDRPMQRKARMGKPRLLSEHRAFSPVLGAWGAALGGLCVLVLPTQLIDRVVHGAGLSLPGSTAQIVLASMAAVLLGGALFAVAQRIADKADRRAAAPAIVAKADDHVRAIDPKRELGSASLDEPLATMPFADEAGSESSEAGTDLPPPQALDLSEFAEMPGRNGVWVVDPSTTAQPDTPALDQAPTARAHPAKRDRPTPPPVHPSDAALARLRASPPEELSTVQMVERFAAALQDHRTGASHKALSHDDATARDAALAEALKALAALSGNGGNDAAPERGEPLRDALSQLQGVRGAA